MATSRLADLNRIYPVIPRVLCGQDFIFRPTEALSNAEGGADGSVCPNHPMRFSSKHPPTKERTHTTTANTIPAQKIGLS